MVGHSDKAELCVYKNPEDPHREEFFVYCHPGMVKKWKQDKSVPMVEVVQVFEVFSSETGGHTGRPMRPSRQALINAFHTDKDNDVISKILEKGEIVQYNGSTERDAPMRTK